MKIFNEEIARKVACMSSETVNSILQTRDFYTLINR